MTYQDTKAIFENSAKEVFGGLRAKGYRYVGVSEKRDDLVGVYFRIEFENRETSRRVALHYVPQTEGRPDVLNLYLESGEQHCFSASEYLKAQNEDPGMVTKLQIKSYVGTLETRMRACLAEMWRFLNETVPTVVDGKEWEDIPIDWGGYK